MYYKLLMLCLRCDFICVLSILMRDYIHCDEYPGFIELEMSIGVICYLMGVYICIFCQFRCFGGLE